MSFYEDTYIEVVASWTLWHPDGRRLLIYDGTHHVRFGGAFVALSDNPQVTCSLDRLLEAIKHKRIHLRKVFRNRHDEVLSHIKEGL